MLKEWLAKDGDLGAIHVEEKSFSCIKDLSPSTRLWAV